MGDLSNEKVIENLQKLYDRDGTLPTDSKLKKIVADVYAFYNEAIQEPANIININLVNMAFSYMLETVDFKYTLQQGVNKNYCTCLAPFEVDDISRPASRERA